MAMKKDDDKSKRTLSGKKPATFGGAKSKLTASKPKAQSPVMVQSLPPIGRDASGSANFNRTAPSRFTGTLGPAKINYGGKTKKSTGGTDMSKGDVLPKKQDNSTAKVSGLISKGPIKTTVTGNYPDNSSSSWNKSNTIAVLAGSGIVGAGVAIKGKKIGQGLKKAAKFIIETPKRIKATREQNEINRKYAAERKAKADAKNPSTPKADIKASKSTMKKLKAK